MSADGRDTSNDRIELPTSTEDVAQAPSRRLLAGYRALRTGPPQTMAPPRALTWADVSILGCVCLLTFVGLAFF